MLKKSPELSLLRSLTFSVVLEMIEKEEFFAF